MNTNCPVCGTIIKDEEVICKWCQTMANHDLSIVSLESYVAMAEAWLDYYSSVWQKRKEIAQAAITKKKAVEAESPGP